MNDTSNHVACWGEMCYHFKRSNHPQLLNNLLKLVQAITTQFSSENLENICTLGYYITGLWFCLQPRTLNNVIGH